MNFDQLSEFDQELLQTDLGEDLEKEAANHVAVVTDMYNHGYNVLAADIADGIDKMAEEAAKAEEEEEEEEGDEQSEKTASECGAFIEKGLFDGLVKLGSERHGDELYYLMPFIEEKVAWAGGQAALSKLRGAMGSVAGKAKGAAGKAGGAASKVKGAAKDYLGAMAQDAKQVFSKRPVGAAGVKGGLPTNRALTDLTAGQRAAAGGKALLRAAPVAAAGGTGVYGVSKLLSKKKEEK